MNFVSDAICVMIFTCLQQKPLLMMTSHAL